MISLEDLPSLKANYNNAVKLNKEIFIFKNQELLTSYAKYLIEHLENQVKK